MLKQSQHANLVSLQAIARLKMATSFPINETSTVEKLATASGLDESDTKRIVRYAVSNRLFQEPECGVIAHTAASNAIAHVPLFREWIEETCDNMWT